MSMSLDKKQQSTTTAPTSNTTTTTTTSDREIHCNATDQHQQQIAPSSLNHNNTSSPHKQHNSMPDTPQACRVATTTPSHSSLKQQPPNPTMAMHNFGPNPLQHEQQMKHQQQTSGDTVPWQINNNTISNTNNNNSSSAQTGTGSNSERANDPQQSPVVNNDHKTTEASPPNQAPNRTQGRQQHQQQQQQSQQQQFHGVFSPNIPLTYQYSIGSRLEQIIRTSLSDPPAVTPPTSKNNQQGNSNSPMINSANSNNMLSPSASSSLMFNSTPGSTTSNTSTPHSIPGHPPNTGLGLISTPSSVGPNTSMYGTTLSSMNELNNGTNNSNNNNLFAKTSPSQMAAAAALNQLSIQRLQQQQLAHTQPSPFINYTETGTNSSSSSAKSSSNGAPVPQAAHGGSHQMSKSLPGSHQHSQLSFPNEQHPDGSINFASRIQLNNAGMSNNLSNKMPLTSSHNLPSWQDQVSHANGPIPRLPPLHGPGNQLAPFTTSSTQSPYGFMNAQLPSGLGLVNNNSMIGQDSDSLAKLNATRNSPGQSNPMQFREEKNIPMTFPTLQSNKQQNNPEFLRGLQTNAFQEALKQRMTDERVTAFAQKLSNHSNKRRIELDKDIRMAIQDSLFYTKYIHLANGILSNQIYIPNFDIIEYLRRSSYPPQEVEHIQRVNKVLSGPDLVCLQELISGRPLIPKATVMDQTGRPIFYGDQGPVNVDQGAMNSHPDHMLLPSMQHGSPMKGSAYLSSSPNRLDPTGRHGIDKSRQSSQSPSDRSRSQIENNIINSKFMNTQSLNNNPQLQQSYGSIMGQQFMPPLYSANQQQQHTSPQANRSSPFQPPMAVGPNTLARPPRSHSTIGGLGVGTFNSPYGFSGPPNRLPPAAHSNSSRPNIPGRSLDLTAAHSNPPSAPVTAHMSTITPRTPKPLLDSLPRSGIRGNMVSDSNNRDPMAANQLDLQQSQAGRSDGLSNQALMSLRQQDATNHEIAMKRSLTPHFLPSNIPGGIQNIDLAQNQGFMHNKLNMPVNQNMLNSQSNNPLGSMGGQVYRPPGQGMMFSAFMPPPTTDSQRPPIGGDFANRAVNNPQSGHQFSQYNAILNNAYMKKQQELSANIPPVSSHGPIPAHGLVMNQPGPMRLPLSEPMHVDIQQQRQSQSQTNSPKTNQRSIITGSASASGRKSKKAKPSPTPLTQTNEIKLTTSEPVAVHGAQKLPNVDNPPAAAADPTKSDPEAPLSFAMQNDLPLAQRATTDAPKSDLGSFVADCTRFENIAREASASSGPSHALVAGPHGADPLQKTCESKTNTPGPACLASSANSSVKAQNINEFNGGGSSVSKSDITTGDTKQFGDIVQTNLQANSTPEQPSKYQKLFSKKAWLKNYELEDQARITEEAAATDEKMAVRTRNKAESEEESTANVIEDKPVTKTNGGTKKLSSTKTDNKKKIKEGKAKKPNPTVSLKSARVPVKGADNDSEGTNASTSDLDDTDETDSMKSSSNKKLRRMPRRKAKTNLDRDTADQPNSITKPKVPKESRDKDSASRKRGKKDKTNLASSNVSSPSKRKCNSDDESVKPKPKKVKEETEKDDSPNQKTKKRAGEKFLQTEPCYEIVPKNIRCLECRRVRQSSLKGDKVTHSKQASKTNWDDFCRFFEFRKLRYNKSAQIVVAGFSDASDAKTSDMRIWLPLESAEVPENITLKVAKFILSNIGDKFCELVQQERSVATAYEIRSGEKRTTWKRAVNGLRELCDVCSTTLFNNHFVCDRCGFVVCIDCHETRSKDTKHTAEDEDAKGDSSEVKNNNENSQHDTNDQVPVVNKKSKKDRHGWIFCAKNEEHSDDKLSLATIIAGDCLEEVWSMLHEIRRRLNLGDCICHSQGKSLFDRIVDNKMDISECAPNESSESHRATHSTLKGLLLASTNSPISDSPDSKVQDSAENGVTIKLEPSSSVDQQVPLKDDNKVFDFGNEDDSQDDSRQVSAAIEGCIASLSVEGCNELDRGSDPEALTSISSRLCDGDLLVLHNPRHRGNTQLFRQHWRLGKPVLVRSVHKKMNIDMWLPQFFLGKFGDYRSDLVDCRNGDTHRKSMRNYWDGFEPTLSKRRNKDEAQPGHIPTPNNEESSASQYSGSALWRLKDWPPGQDFKEILPEHYDDFMNNLPLKSYTTRSGRLNLACRLPKEMLKPDLGPKMYSAYGTTKFPERGTTNLHLDISDAINVMVYVGGAMPFSQGLSEYSEMYDGTISDCYVDPSMKEQIRKQKLIPGALWHIFRPCDATKIRDCLNKVSDERNASDKRIDPIHDQTWYLDQSLLDRLQREYGVKSYPVLQCMGDAILIPAGAPHQVKNLQNCIKVANDFVSPENIEYCLQLTDEFRKLPETHINQEDKLQIKNIVYHSVKESIQYIKMFESGKVSLSDESLDEDDFDDEEAVSDLKTNMPPSNTKQPQE